MGLEAALAALRAAGEETRLRLLVLLAEGDLTVSDLTDILGQSQPRISRHLKLMVEAGLITRHREGSWAFFRLAQHQDGAPLAQWLVEGLAEQGLEEQPTSASSQSRPVGAIHQSGQFPWSRGVPLGQGSQRRPDE